MLSKNYVKKENAIRDIFGLALAYYAEKDPKVLCISPDLKQATKLSYFFKKFPERSIECGISEANSIGISAGLSLMGFKVFVASFASFITGKNIEIRNSIAQNSAPVIVVGTHGGLIGPDGPSQAGIQDISVMRSIPNFKVYQPSTPVETDKIVEHLITTPRKDAVYLRISRENSIEVFDDNYNFVEGKFYEIIPDYQDCVVITSGPVIKHCYAAVKDLRKKYKIGLINLPTIKPLNDKQLIDIVKKTKRIFTVEDHSILGGLGSAINERIIANSLNKKICIYNHGIKDTFTQSDDVENLYKFFKLDKNSIKNILTKFLAK